MKITLINSFFLPVPPVAGGSTEKIWFRLGREFAARGHAVTSFSRTWRGFPRTEIIDGVRHVRLRGVEHHRALWRNLLRDFAWSRRIFRALPPADIVLCNAVTLPLWLGRLAPAAGRVVLVAGRMPKGQYRFYRHISRVLAPSGVVRDRIAAENPALAGAVRVTGNPLDWSLLAQPGLAPSELVPPRTSPEEVTLGFVGRLHEEKGLRLLAEAVALLDRVSGLPSWRLVLCGPADVARGGSGEAFLRSVRQRLAPLTERGRVQLLEPIFDERALARLYRRFDVFCYPSLAAQGETFGVAAAEAMAAGAAPVVSKLACFREFVRDGETGLVFDHTAADAPRQLAAALERLMRDAALRRKLAAAAQAETRRYDFPVFADALLADFATLLDAPPKRQQRTRGAP